LGEKWLVTFKTFVRTTIIAVSCGPIKDTVI